MMKNSFSKTFIVLLFLSLLILFLFYLRTSIKIIQLSSSLDSESSNLLNAQTSFVTVALGDVEDFNPEKRTALYFAFTRPDGGYESRFKDHFAQNSSQESLVAVRNDFMRSFLSVRKEASAHQETLANLLDMIDGSITNKIILGKEVASNQAIVTWLFWVMVSLIALMIVVILFF